MRVNYSLLDRYVLTFTLRRDGSSYFAKNNKWGLFPSVSAAWRISEEDFMKQPPGHKQSENPCGLRRCRQ